MITKWKEEKLENFLELKKEFMRGCWKKKVIEILHPKLVASGFFSSRFIGNTKELDLEKFKELVIELPDIVELKKAAETAQEVGIDKRIINDSFNKTLEILMEDLPRFAFDCAKCSSIIFPLRDNVDEFLDLSFKTVEDDSAKKTKGSSVMYTHTLWYKKEGNNTRKISYNLPKKDIDNNDLYIYYRVWDIDSFNRFIKNFTQQGVKENSVTAKYLELMLSSLDISIEVCPEL